MSEQPLPSEPRIALEAIREMDEIARQFRRRLRACAVQLWQGAERSTPIGPGIISEAIPLACQQMLSDADSHLRDERESDGQRPQAA